MNQESILDIPSVYPDLLKKSEEIGFTMPSDIHLGILLKTLISSKPNGRFLELGTGIGLSLSWMIEGMDEKSKLISIDNDPNLCTIAKSYFDDHRVSIVNQDGSDYILNYTGEKFDLIFADAWPGKYSEIEEILNLVKPGGFYIVDDMIRQSNWPDGHEDYVENLVDYMEQREDFHLTKMNWSTGIIIAVKKV